jgi:5-methylcytosine-specific restriction endonuclease McrA
MNQKLLPRDIFRSAIFARDKHSCVLCGGIAQDAHHILDRKLCHDGGYYMDNGVSVCASCHILCEKGVSRRS